MNTIKPEDLRQMLNEGIVNFAYKKLDGELRHANGTTSLTHVPKESHPSGVRESSNQVIRYFDNDKQSWRSVSVTTDIYIVE